MKKFFILFLVFLVTGCYNYRELSDLAIVKGASVDIVNGEYVVNYVISSNEKEEITILEGKGKTISDAISKMNLTSPKDLYIGHMLIYVISEDVAKLGINKVIDYFFRNASSKKTFQFVIAKDKSAKEILKAIPRVSKLPADNIAKNLTSEASLSEFVFNTTLLSFLKNIKDFGIEPVINGITIDKNDTLKIEPLAIFKDDKFIKWEDEIVSECTSILINQSDSFKIDDEMVSFSINDLSVKRSFKITDKINFKFKIKGKSEINEMSLNYDLNNPHDIQKLEDILVNTLKENLNKTIEELKKTEIDFLGIGNYIYQNDYKNYLKFKDSYIEKLNVTFDIEPNLLKIENEGTIRIYE